jgi:CheY-like chemotaxis protein
MTENLGLRPSNPDQTVILIAEDDVVVRSIAQIVLEAAGYFVLPASDGADALNMLAIIKRRSVPDIWPELALGELPKL